MGAPRTFLVAEHALRIREALVTIVKHADRPARPVRLSRSEAVRLPLRLIPPGARTTVLSGPLRGTRWIVGASTHACWLGTYERDKLELFVASLCEGDVVYDVGAHVGVYSLVAARHVGPLGRVYAFEPLPRNLGYLNEHLALNGVKNCTVLEAAVGSEAGTATFDKSVHPAMGHLGATGGPVISVRTVVIDDLVTSGAIRPPAVIKLDIEGAEYEALRGATQTLARARPIVFVATHGPEVHRRCCELLEDAGFEVCPLGEVPLADTTEIVALPR